MDALIAMKSERFREREQVAGGFSRVALRVFGVFSILVLAGIPIWLAIDTPVPTGAMIRGKVDSSTAEGLRGLRSARLHVSLETGGFAVVHASESSSIATGTEVLLEERRLRLSRLPDYRLAAVIGPRP